MRDHYEVGGSLRQDAPSYVTRQSDLDLYDALLNGELCYVFNARQMGKSSLRVRVQSQIERQGKHCVAIDMTGIGSEYVQPEQWYKSFAADLLNSFQLWEQVNFKQWWQDQDAVTPLRRLSLLIEEILQVHLPQASLFIFIDEIDSLLSLPFAVDDFFAWIRYCYNQRAQQPAYQRLNWALFGVTAPSELIRDRHRTPFNIGRAIELRGFQASEVQPLIEGLVGIVTEPAIVLWEILAWTGGQPFLTQKLCRLITHSVQFNQAAPLSIPPGTEGFWVEQLVQSHLIEHWQTQDQPEHLRTIRDRLLRQEQRTGRLLGLYQQILETNGVAIDASPEQTELLLSGLVEKHQDRLRVKNRIYQSVFNPAWVQAQLAKLRPYSQTFDAWIASGQTDESRLLRGQALLDAQTWSQDKQLSDLDYRFLAASGQYDRQEAQRDMEAKRAQDIQTWLIKERQTAQLQRRLITGLSLSLAMAIGVSLIAWQQYREARFSEVEALVSSSQGLFASNRQLDAMIAAIKANRQLQRLSIQSLQFAPSKPLATEAETVLRQAIYGSNEFNRLIGHRGAVLSVDISPDGQLIATGSNDKTVKIWHRDGRLLHTLNHVATVHRIAFSPNSQQLVSGTLDGTLTLWQINGDRLLQIPAHAAPIWGVAFSPDGDHIASASADSTTKIWHLDGSLQAALEEHGKAVWAVEFSPDGQQVATASVDSKVRLWSATGRLLQTLQGHQAAVWDLAFCSADLLVSVSSDRTAKLWHLDGRLEKTLQNDSPLLGTDCSTNGEYIATSGQDNFVQLWRPDGTFIRALKQHNAVIRDVALSKNGLMAASGSDDGTVKLWQRNQYLLKPLHDHKGTIWETDTSPDGKLIATASSDGTLKLWQTDGMLWQTIPAENAGFRTVRFSPDARLMVTGDMGRTVQLWELSQPGQPGGTVRKLRMFTGHQASIYAVAFSPDGQTIASAGDDKTIKLWNLNGDLLHSFPAHNERIWQLDFSPLGDRLASASEDGTVKLWTATGRLLNTLVGQGAIWGATFSPSGDRLISVSYDDTIKFWQPNGKFLKTIPAQSGGLTRVAFSPDGKTFATAGVDNTVKLWSESGQLLTTLTGHQGIVISLAFSADGHYLISGGDEGAVILWDLPKVRALQPLEYACTWVKDYLRTNLEVETADRHLCDRTALQ